MLEEAKLQREVEGFRPRMDGEPEDASVSVETPTEVVAVVMPMTTVGLETALSLKSTSSRLEVRLEEVKEMMSKVSFQPRRICLTPHSTL